MDLKKKTQNLIQIAGIVILFLAISLSCIHKSETEKITFPYAQEVEFDTLVNQIIIKNPSDSMINIRLYINNKFWYTQEEILSAVKDIETDSLPGLPMDAAKAWAFVMENSFHYNQIYLEKEFTYQPLYLFNSWGGALCSHRNSALAQIWEWQGYKTRCIQLKEHVISEVFYRDKWMLLDADFNTYFLNKEGQIADYSELENSIETFKMQSSPTNMSIMHFLMQFDKAGYFNHFKGSHNNRIEPWFTEDIP
ncbi:MAG: hypothetical protein U9N51_00715, partial [Bacteroidota bacterium]|nr:hypothetical protein [Bacteroidota bacterium]